MGKPNLGFRQPHRHHTPVQYPANNTRLECLGSQIQDSPERLVKTAFKNKIKWYIEEIIIQIESWLIIFSILGNENKNYKFCEL